MTESEMGGTKPKCLTKIKAIIDSCHLRENE